MFPDIRGYPVMANGIGHRILILVFQIMLIWKKDSLDFFFFFWFRRLPLYNICFGEAWLLHQYSEQRRSDDSASDRACQWVIIILFHNLWIYEEKCLQNISIENFLPNIRWTWIEMDSNSMRVLVNLFMST